MGSLLRFPKLFALFFQLLDALFWLWQVFWHSPAKLFNCLSYFFAYCPMGLVCCNLAANTLSLEFFFRLGCPEEICRQLCASHMIENFVALFQFLLDVNVARAKAAV